MKTSLTALFFILFSAINAQTINHTIHFDSGKSNVSKDDQAWIDSISSVLKNVQSYSVEVAGFCDATGNEEANIQLSMNRAESAEQVFLKNGSDKALIKLKYSGEKDPVADNSTEKGKQENRRVEIVIRYYEKTADPQPRAEPQKTESAPVVKSKSVLPEKKLTEEKLELGKTLILKNLNFEGGTSVLLPESGPVLKD